MSFIGAVATSVRQVSRVREGRAPACLIWRRELYRPERAALGGFADQRPFVT